VNARKCGEVECVPYMKASVETLRSRGPLFEAVPARIEAWDRARERKNLVAVDWLATPGESGAFEARACCPCRAGPA